MASSTTRLIRSAFWVGRPREGREEAFERAMNLELVPGLGELPGVIAARALWPEKREDDPPAIYCQVLVEFADRSAMELMLSSPGRAALRDRVREVAAIFEGTLSHIDYAVGAADAL